MGLSTSRVLARSAMVVVLTVVASACVPGGDGSTSDDDGTIATEGSEAPQLAVVDEASAVYCDNTDRLIGEIQGLEPGEKLVVSSPQPIQLSAEQLDAVANEDGVYELTWRCSPSEVGQPWELRVEGQDSKRRAAVSFVGSSTDPDSDDDLQVTLLGDAFVCDGRSKTLGQLSNAAALEPVAFKAERADDLVDGTADAEGRLALTWQCSPDEAGTWEITAWGVESNRSVRFTIVGERPDDIPTPTVDVDEDPFACDGVSREFATLSGFLPDEFVALSSPQSSSLVDGRADDSGDLPVQWTCGAADAGKVWELTATGALSARTVTFTVTGAPAPPTPDPTVAMSEDPFRCDDATRFFATIGGFAPREFVDFTSPQVEDLRQGQADDTGTLHVRWTCDADDIGKTWEVTATGATTLRSATFQITGAPPEE